MVYLVQQEAGASAHHHNEEDHLEALYRARRRALAKHLHRARCSLDLRQLSAEELPSLVRRHVLGHAKSALLGEDALRAVLEHHSNCCNAKARFAGSSAAERLAVGASATEEERTRIS